MGMPDRNKSVSSAAAATHPDAPAMPAGTGFFRDANSFAYDDIPNLTVRHARSPAGGEMGLQVSAGAPLQALGTASKKANPPPSTTPRSQTIARIDNEVMDVVLSVKILADERSSDSVHAQGAVTRVTPSDAVRSPTPLRFASQNGRILKIEQRFRLHGVYTIQTSYGDQASPRDPSLYGRGTTTKDKANGDTTLGFHEWCHQQEFWDHLIKATFPQLAVEVGQSVAEFRKADADFARAVRAFGAELSGLGTAVDEVGYKKSRCKAEGKCS